VQSFSGDLHREDKNGRKEPGIDDAYHHRFVPLSILAMRVR
jgi:hypothetical protein